MKMIFLLIPLFVFSQNLITATYTYNNNFFVEENILSVDNENFVYRKLSSTTDFSKSNVYSQDFLDWKPSDKDVVFYGNRSTDELHILSRFRGDRVIKIDSLPAFDWLITKVSKVKDGVVLFKATTKFRGSKITAYFNPDIAISLGPYKFRGLPGLIYEVNAINDNSYHNWVLTSLKSGINEIMKLDKSNNYKEYSFKDTVIMTDSDKRKESQISSSRTSSDIKITSYSFTRNGVEQVYEWETTDEKN